eukprot:3578687-Pyramimonas_sp.AAC.1
MAHLFLACMLAGHRPLRGPSVSIMTSRPALAPHGQRGPGSSSALCGRRRTRASYRSGTNVAIGGRGCAQF